MQPPARFRPPVTTAYRSSRHETSEWQVTWQDTNSRSPGHVTTPTPAGPTSTFTFSGTFGIILPTGALVGALLGWAEYQRRAGRKYLALINFRVPLTELASCARAFDEAAPSARGGRTGGRSPSRSVASHPSHGLPVPTATLPAADPRPRRSCVAGTPLTDDSCLRIVLMRAPHAWAIAVEVVRS